MAFCRQLWHPQQQSARSLVHESPFPRHATNPFPASMQGTKSHKIHRPQQPPHHTFAAAPRESLGLPGRAQPRRSLEGRQRSLRARAIAVGLPPLHRARESQSGVPFAAAALPSSQGRSSTVRIGHASASHHEVALSPPQRAPRLGRTLDSFENPSRGQRNPRRSWARLSQPRGRIPNQFLHARRTRSPGPADNLARLLE
mmetsp:Transcript_77259/g.185036  ORF Transcript_77259/g.185036 Transcript_77259/m.185036 type:complete len:200 (+) Transcript_77259:792-1391(+)